jgi:hypothetical protein
MKKSKKSSKQTVNKEERNLKYQLVPSKTMNERIISRLKSEKHSNNDLCCVNNNCKVKEHKLKLETSISKLEEHFDDLYQENPIGKINNNSIYQTVEIANNFNNNAVNTKDYEHTTLFDLQDTNKEVKPVIEIVYSKKKSKESINSNKESNKDLNNLNAMNILNVSKGSVKVDDIILQPDDYNK